MESKKSILVSDDEIGNNLFKYTYFEKRNDDFFPCVDLVLYKFKIIKETPCGHWIEDDCSLNDKKWVSKVGKNVFARLSPEKALTDFVIKKKKQISILEYNVKVIKLALRMAEIKRDENQ